MKIIKFWGCSRWTRSPML